MPDLTNSSGSSTRLFSGPQLVVAWPDGTTEIHKLTADEFHIGRGPEGNDLALPTAHKSISRRHLVLRREGSTYHAEDLGSSNGTRLNGAPLLAAAPLSDGDLLAMGAALDGQEVVLTYQAGTSALLAALKEAPQAESAPAAPGLLAQPPQAEVYLQVTWTNGTVQYYSLDKEITLVGRSSEADLQVPQRMRFVSSQHLSIQQSAGQVFATDLNSRNGTRVNNKLLEPGVQTSISNGSIIRIGDDVLGLSIGLRLVLTGQHPLQAAGFVPVADSPTLMGELNRVVIGREAGCGLVLGTPEVSRQHAAVEQVNGSYFIEDLGSVNGTLVNQQPIRRQELKEGDVIQVGTHILIFMDGLLTKYQSSGMRVDVSGLSKTVKTARGPLKILHDIDMTILPREFVALVGGSGAGKSTLMNALIGIRKGEGDVQLNGHDFYEELDHYRAQLGYVPQADILHTTLTVEKALDYAAQLRLPPDTTRAERGARISEVLETVSMNTETIRSTRIGSLSGGQRKRVSIASELLANPKLIYLDEATSGLDPGLEKKMMDTLQRMADEGRTVILITHATANIVQTDNVAFLSQGRLVYFGPSQEALDFFDVDDFADIYGQIERQGEAWEQVFQEQKPQQYEDYVLARKKSRAAMPKRELPRVKFSLGDFLNQFRVLTLRAFSVLMSDWFTLVLMLLLFPLTATLQLVISTPDVLTGSLGILADPAAAAKTLMESYIPFADLNTFVFVMGLEAALVGMYVPSNELIKERSVYLRERMVNLKVPPYLLSKVAVFTLFAAIQTFFYLVVLSLGVDLPEQGLYFSGPVELFITLFFSIMAGIGIGFIVSAVSRSSDMAIYVLVILLFFQFFFAGTVFDLRGNRAEALSYLTITRWSLTALGVTVGIEDQVAATILCNNPPDNPLTPQNEAETTVCFHYPDAVEDLMLSYEDEALVQSWLVLLGMTVAALGVTGVLIKRLD